MDYPIAKCRSCQADIIWAQTDTGAKPTPLDAKPEVRAVIIDAKTGSRGEVVPVVTVTKAYLSHFATCPNAEQHRKKS